MKLFRTSLLAAAAIAVAVPAAVSAHRMWMVPSATIVSGDDNWVTVDAAVSNDLFYPDHRPLSAEPVVTAPDGSTLAVENRAVGAVRATFDVHLKQQGTYKVAVVGDSVFGSYALNGQTVQIPRGTTADKFTLPAGATDVRVSQNSMRNELYLTAGAPTNTVFKTVGKGIELVPVTHPNDLIAGEPATFQFLLDGKPAANLPVTIVPGGKRYREALGQIDLKTDAQGNVTVKWPAPGMYWLNVAMGGSPEGGMGPRPEGGRGPGGAGGPGAQAEGGPRPEGAPRPAGPPQRRASYVTTLEVLGA